MANEHVSPLPYSPSCDCPSCLASRLHRLTAASRGTTTEGPRSSNGDRGVRLITPRTNRSLSVRVYAWTITVNLLSWSLPIGGRLYGATISTCRRKPSHGWRLGPWEF